MNFVESMPPNVNSPLGFDNVGAKDMETTSDGMTAWANKLSVTVGGMSAYITKGEHRSSERLLTSRNHSCSVWT